MNLVCEISNPLINHCTTCASLKEEEGEREQGGYKTVQVILYLLKSTHDIFVVFYIIFSRIINVRDTVSFGVLSDLPDTNTLLL